MRSGHAARAVSSLLISPKQKPAFAKAEIATPRLRSTFPTVTDISGGMYKIELVMKRAGPYLLTLRPLIDGLPTEKVKPPI
eukprot:1456803-Pleurochrysis_carterae.AAC.1